MNVVMLLPVKLLTLLAGVLGLLVMSGCENVPNKKSTTPQMMFAPAGNDIIALEPVSRRKWDSAIVADLDQDGFVDLLLTEHSQKVKLYWNNQGRYAAPVDLALGDTHGIGVSDYNQDGLIDIIVSQGGGGGKKPRYPKIYHVDRMRNISGGEEFTLYERSRGRAVKLLDGDNDGKLDALFSAFPLKSQPKGANQLYQNSQQSLHFHGLLPTAKWLGYKTLVTDFNNDNDQDVIFYGGDNIIAVQGETGLAYRDNSGQVLAKLSNTKHVSSIAEIDFDNDGDQDLVLTRAQHQFHQQRFYDAKQQRFAFFARNEKFQFDDLHIEGDLVIENLQMAYPHFDIFVGQNKQLLKAKQTDRHGEKSLTLTAEQAMGWPSELDKKGLYIGYLGNGMWRIGGDTHSPTAGVVHRVLSTPNTTKPLALPVKLFENVNGKFIDASDKLNLTSSAQTTSATVADFNNDGFSDIFIVNSGNMATANKQTLLLNKQGKSFEVASNHGLISTELGATGAGAQALDYDNDGDVDIIFGNERGRWHLFSNQLITADKTPLSNNHFLHISVGKSLTQGASAMTAKVTVLACQQQLTQVVGSTGSAFSHAQMSNLHFGLGSCKQPQQAHVVWSNGEQQTLLLNKADLQYFAGQQVIH
ncbi:CRTAC1 family protein [Thalassotalea sp. PLHSN55]|uniref:CRTAC1 family protein n=1 Tax=Thalassotalea sp. PLHSN55 TaxID=3435888 RepID=UPI003F85F56B